MVFLSKITGFVIDYYAWVRAGRPRRDPVWVKELWVICSSCDKFDPQLITPFGTGGCKLCGCYISPDHTETINKLVWPNTSCPDNPPRWSAVIGPNPEEQEVPHDHSTDTSSQPNSSH